MEILKDIRNDLFKRQEINAIIESEKNPDFTEMKKQVSEQTGKPEENINVYNIKGSFGSKEFKIDAYVYDSKEDLEKNKKKKKQEKESSGEKEQIKMEEKEEKTEESGEAPVEEKPEQETKAVEEEKEAEEESK